MLQEKTPKALQPNYHLKLTNGQAKSTISSSQTQAGTPPAQTPFFPQPFPLARAICNNTPARTSPTFCAKWGPNALAPSPIAFFTPSPASPSLPPPISLARATCAAANNARARTQVLDLVSPVAPAITSSSFHLLHPPRLAPSCSSCLTRLDNCLSWPSPCHLSHCLLPVCARARLNIRPRPPPSPPSPTRRQPPTSTIKYPSPNRRLPRTESTAKTASRAALTCPWPFYTPRALLPCLYLQRLSVPAPLFRGY